MRMLNSLRDGRTDRDDGVKVLVELRFDVEVVHRQYTRT